MCERPHDPAQEEGHAECSGLQGAQVVDDVLYEGEPDADQSPVDQPVEQAVDLGPPEDDDDNQEQALSGFFDERCDDRRLDECAGSGNGEEQLLGDQAEGHCHHAAPADCGQPVARRLRFVAVEPEQHQDQQREGDRGQQGGDQAGDRPTGEHDQDRDEQGPQTQDDHGHPGQRGASAAQQLGRYRRHRRGAVRPGRDHGWSGHGSLSCLPRGPRQC
jgi:hypothetical protein